MSADATGNFILTGDNALLLTTFALAFSPVSPLSENDGKTTPSLRKKLVRLFSPREPLFLLTGDNALLLTTFALAFSPVDPFSVAAFAALRVSFPGTCPGKDEFLF